MGEKDMTEKILEDFNDVFADIINVLLFNGEQIVQPESLQEAGVKSHYKADDTKLHEQERDVAKYWEDGKVRICLYGIENQTQEDKDMPLRMISYDGAGYRSQLLSEDEKRYPVVSLVLHYGLGHWTHPKRLKECLSIPPALDPYVSDHQMNVFEISWLSEEQVEKFKSDFGIVADYFVQKRKTHGYVPSAKVIKHVDETIKLMNVMTGDSRFAEVAGQLPKKEGGITMCDVVDKFVEKGKEQGIEQGEKNARIQLLTNGIKGGVCDEQLINIFNFTTEEIKAVKQTLAKKNTSKPGYPENRRKLHL